MTEESSNRVAERFAMSRGILVVDENVQALAHALRAANIRVIIPRSGMLDPDIKTELLPRRIFVTKNTRDFKDDASSFEYGIVSLDKLKFIDAEPNPTKNVTVRLISKAIIDHHLWQKQHGFLLTLEDSGNHRYEDLVE